MRERAKHTTERISGLVHVGCGENANPLMKGTTAIMLDPRCAWTQICPDARPLLSSRGRPIPSSLEFLLCSEGLFLLFLFELIFEA